MHRPGFGASSSFAQACAARWRRTLKHDPEKLQTFRIGSCDRTNTCASTARPYAFPPRERGLSACLRAAPGGQDARVGGTGGGFQQRAAQAAICRGPKASRGEARRQPRLSRGASRSAQHGAARQVAIGCRVARAARRRAAQPQLWPQPRAAPGVARRAERRLRRLQAAVPARALRRSLPRDATGARAPVRQVQHRARAARRR
jgi:hypothetical protein